MATTTALPAPCATPCSLFYQNYKLAGRAERRPAPKCSAWLAHVAILFHAASLIFDHMFQLPLSDHGEAAAPVIVLPGSCAAVSCLASGVTQLNPFDLVVLLSLSNPCRMPLSETITRLRAA